MYYHILIIYNKIEEYDLINEIKEKYKINIWFEFFLLHKLKSFN